MVTARTEVRMAALMRRLLSLVSACCMVFGQRSEPPDRGRVVHVVVVDADGNRAAGVPVAAVFPAGDRLVPGVFGTSFMISDLGVPPLIVAGVSDATGACDLDLRQGGSSLSMYQLATGAESIAVELRLGAPFSQAPSKRFLLNDAPKETVNLVCPASTALEVRLVASDGTPETRPSFVTVAKLMQSPSQAASETIGLRGTAASARDGVARFPHIGTGQRVRIAARIEAESRPRFAEIDIPATSDRGTTQTVVLAEVDSGVGVDLVARVLGPGGKPLARTKVVVTATTEPALVVLDGFAEAASRKRAIRTVSTDGDGNISVRFETMADPDPWVITTIGVRAGVSWLYGLGCEGDLILPRGLRRGTDDVGEIRLARSTNVVSGTVVDENLDPVDGAALVVEARNSALFGVDIEQQTKSAEVLDPSRWYPVSGLRGFSATDGRFTVYGTTPKRPIRVSAKKPGYFQPAVLPATKGERGARVILVRGAEVRGRVLLDEGVPTSDVTIALQGDFEREVYSSQAETKRSRHSYSKQLESEEVIGAVNSSDGSFTFPAIPSGIVEIEVRVSDVKVANVGKVRVTRGETVRPSELDPLDLRGKLKLRRVRVHDDQMRPIQGAEVWFRQNNTRMVGTRVIADANGIATIATVDAEPLHATVRGPSGGLKAWSEVTLGEVGASASAALRRLPVVRFRLKNPEALPLPPYYVACVLDPAAETDDAPFGRSGPFGDSERGAHLDGAGVGRMTVAEAGSYKVRVLLWVNAIFMAYDIPLRFSGPQVVRVENDGSDSFELEVDPASVREAIQESIRRNW